MKTNDNINIIIAFVRRGDKEPKSSIFKDTLVYMTQNIF